VIDALGHPPVMACTATATPKVAEEIVARLGLREPERVRSGFDRPNLSFDVIAFDGEGSVARKRALLADGLAMESNRPAIVYCGTRKSTEEVAEELGRAGLSTVAYHAGMTPVARSESQRAFMAGEAEVVVATNAFGMGVDKADVRSVWHWALPSSLEAYYQEAGRAGRDGLPSRCVLLAEKRDKGLHVFFINQIDDPEAKRHRWRQYREVWGFVEGERCRRAAILRHFGDRSAPEALGRCCDLCDRAAPLVMRRTPAVSPGAKRPGTADGASVEQAIVEVVAAAQPSVGRTRTVEILRGGRSKVVRKYSYDELPGYGDFDDWRAGDLLREVDALIDRGLLRSTGGRFPKLRVVQRAA
jgi:RecQ family ATP-dependent DNA helicase